MKKKVWKETALHTGNKKRNLVMGVTILMTFLYHDIYGKRTKPCRFRPSMREFGAGSQTVNWVVTAYMLTCTGLAIPFDI